MKTILLLFLPLITAGLRFTRTPEDQTGVDGGVASFVCQATGDPPPNIVWNKNGTNIQNERFEAMEFDNGSGSILRIQPLRTTRDKGIYECHASNSAGEITASARLSVLREHQLPSGFPSIDMGPQLKVVRHSQTATMICAASGNPNPEITWFKDFLPFNTSSNNGRIKQLRSGALQIEMSEESDQGKYECVATNRDGTRYSSPANLYVRVRRVPPRISIPPANSEIKPGGNINISCVGVGSPMPYVKWMLGAENLTPEDDMPIGRNVLELTDVRQSNNYTCVAMSSLGVIKAVAQIIVKDLPNAPGTPVVTERTATSVTLTWDSGNPEPVSYYILQHRAKGIEPYKEINGITKPLYSVGGLSPYSHYDFRVAAVNTVGQGPSSEVVEVLTAEQAPSSPPRRVRGRMLSTRTAIIHWDEPDEPNGQVVGNRVYYTSNNTLPVNQWEKQIVRSTNFTIIHDLTPNKTYYIRVLAFTSEGDGPLSLDLQIMAKTGVPSQPSEFMGVAKSETSILLSWVAPLQGDSDNQITGYDLVYRRADDTEETKVSFEPTSSYLLKYLKPFSTYTFQLAAKSKHAVGVYTNEMSIDTPQTPRFTRTPEDQTGVEGGVASFVCQATGNPQPNIVWNKKGKKVSKHRYEIIEFDNGSGSVLRIQPLRTIIDEVIYECHASNSAGEVTASARLSVLREDQLPYGFPTIDMGPQLKVVEHSRGATMVCAARGNPKPEITWFKNFLPVNTSNNNRRIKQLHSGALQIAMSEESDQGKYECVATNRDGTLYSSPANLYVRVRRAPPRISIPPANSEIKPGGNINISCVAVGSPMPYVKWMLGAENLTPEDDMPIGRNVLELTDVRQSNNYTCVAMSSLGVIKAVAQIIVKDLPNVPGTPVVTERTATSVTLTWDSGNPEPVSYYILQHRAKGSEDPYKEIDGITTTLYSVGGLSPNSHYDFRVAAVNTIGQGPSSEVLEVRTALLAPSTGQSFIKQNEMK